MLIDVAPITSHVSVACLPEPTVDGLAEKIDMIGALVILTVSVADLVELPASLEAVSVYVVVSWGDTSLLPLGSTLPISGLMETDFALETPHDRVAL